LFNHELRKFSQTTSLSAAKARPHAKEKHRFLANVTFAPDPLSPLLKARIGEGFMFKGFRDFVLRGNVVDLAVGVVIGAAFGTVVTALVKDLLTPIIAAIVRKPDFSGFFFELNGAKFLYGDFLNAAISFLLIAAAVYFFVVLPVNKLMSRFHKPVVVDKKKCPECRSDIPLEARRCAFCTSPVA
jgi:large conductance mechanosensitive channel